MNEIESSTGLRIMVIKGVLSIILMAHFTLCLYKEWMFKLYAVIKLIYDESTRDKVAELSGPLSQPLCDSIHLYIFFSHLMTIMMIINNLNCFDMHINHSSAH